MVPEEDSQKSRNPLTSNTSVSCEKLPYPGRTQNFRGWLGSSANDREQTWSPQRFYYIAVIVGRQ